MHFQPEAAELGNSGGPSIMLINVAFFIMISSLGILLDGVSNMLRTSGLPSRCSPWHTQAHCRHANTTQAARSEVLTTA